MQIPAQTICCFLFFARFFIYPAYPVFQRVKFEIVKKVVTPQHLSKKESSQERKRYYNSKKQQKESGEKKLL